MNYDLFGLPYVEPQRAKQLALFHEPVAVPYPSASPLVASKIAVDPAHTIALPFSQIDNGGAEEMTCAELRQLARSLGHDHGEPKKHRMYYYQIIGIEIE